MKPWIELLPPIAIGPTPLPLMVMEYAVLLKVRVLAKVMVVALVISSLLIWMSKYEPDERSGRVDPRGITRIITTRVARDQTVFNGGGS